MVLNDGVDVDATQTLIEDTLKDDFPLVAAATPYGPARFRS